MSAFTSTLSFNNTTVNKINTNIHKKSENNSSVRNVIRDVLAFTIIMAAFQNLTLIRHHVCVIT